MPRAFHIPGIIFLFCAFVLLFLVSISLPFLTALDFARVHFNEGTPTVGTDTNPIKELRVSPGCDGILNALSSEALTSISQSLCVGSVWNLVSPWTEGTSYCSAQN